MRGTRNNKRLLMFPGTHLLAKCKRLVQRLANQKGDSKMYKQRAHGSGISNILVIVLLYQGF